jgi:four helix bundle protein
MNYETRRWAREGDVSFVPAVFDIRERALAYSLRAIKLYQALQKKRDGAALIIGTQFLRSALSIGANIAEAQSAESKADFVHKFGIAQKEARESAYWLELLLRSTILPSNRLDELRQETGEIIAVITTIIVKTKANRKC